MTIFAVNYRETIFEHTNLTKITGVPNYKTLHLLHNEINVNAMAVHSNLGSGQHGYLKLVVIPTAYALLVNNPFVRQVHTGDLRIPIVDTHHAQEEPKR